MLKVFENWEPRNILLPKREEIRGGWRMLHDGELYDFYSSPHIIREKKCRRVRWAGHVAHMRGKSVEGLGGET